MVQPWVCELFVLPCMIQRLWLVSGVCMDGKKNIQPLFIILLLLSPHSLYILCFGQHLHVCGETKTSSHPSMKTKWKVPRCSINWRTPCHGWWLKSLLVSPSGSIKTRQQLGSRTSRLRQFLAVQRWCLWTNVIFLVISCQGSSVLCTLHNNHAEQPHWSEMWCFHASMLLSRNHSSSPSTEAKSFPPLFQPETLHHPCATGPVVPDRATANAAMTDSETDQWLGESGWVPRVVH